MSKENKEEQLREIFNSERLPIVTLDNRWHQLYASILKPSYIQKLENDLNDLLKQQGKVNSELKDLKKLKKHMMQEIVNNMEEASENFEKKRQKKLLKSKMIIGDINAKINALELIVDNIPVHIKDANERLVIASVEDLYIRLNQNDLDLEEIAEWINRTRVELKKRILIKQEKEEINQQIYTYMHDLLGSNCMEFFDKQNGILK